jgi:hypothetical protein
MVAFKLLDKAMSQLARQRDFSAHFDPSMAAPGYSCNSMQPKSQSQSQPGVTVQAIAPRSPLKAATKTINWLPGLELLGGHHEPWTVSKPRKPILKSQEDSAKKGFATEDTHWAEHSEALALPAPMTIPVAKSTCIKLFTKKRTREVAFSD